MKTSPYCFIGTSGWFYSWNEDRSLDWYLNNSGLNAIELNASFYRFPFPTQVKSWATKGKKLRWAIKVNRLITHQFKFGEQAVETFNRFLKLFSVMDGLIDFYLFQLPPNFSPRALKKLERFIEEIHPSLRKRFALEVRHQDWFQEAYYQWAKAKGITWVSIDSPEFPREIIKTTDTIYLRIHGRTAWYSHDYSKKELTEIARRILASLPKSIYIFFNNNQAMLKNAQKMQEIISEMMEATGG